MFIINALAQYDHALYTATLPTKSSINCSVMNNKKEVKHMEMRHFRVIAILMLKFKIVLFRIFRQN